MINEFNLVKYDVFDVIHIFMKTFYNKNTVLSDEYQNIFYAILSNIENTLIDEEGIAFLCMIMNLNES